MVTQCRYRWQSERLVTLKIINTYSFGDATRERDLEEHIARQNQSHRGYSIIRTFLQSFEVAGPEGNHLCLAYEPMRELLWVIQNRFVDQKLRFLLPKHPFLFFWLALTICTLNAKLSILASNLSFLADLVL